MKKKLIKTARNSRVPCICSVRTAKLIYQGYVIGTISEESNDAEEFDWVIRPDWKVIKENNIKVQISGIDMSLELEEYIRSYVPAFVEERTLPEGRERLHEELQAVGLYYNDRFEFMCRTHKCGCNKIIVDRLTEEEQKEFDRKYPISELKY